MFLQEEHELNEKFHSILRKIYFRKYVFFYSVQRNFAYWLETQPINHNKELDAYTISVHSRSGYFRQFHLSRSRCRLFYASALAQ